MAFNLNYTSYDYETIKQDLINIVKAKDAWKDAYESTTGMTFIELFAVCLQLQMYYLERRAEEVYIGTAKNKSSVVELVRLINYQPKRKIGATGTLRFTIAATNTKRIFIPQYTECQTVNGMKFVTVEDVTIEVGQTFVDVTAIQGTLVTSTYAADGSTDQQYVIDDTSVENDDHIAIVGFKAFIVTIAGEEWTKVSSFISSSTTSTDYKLRAELDDTLTIIFGDGVRGMVPISGTTITIQYIQTDGADGNVYETEKVTTLNDIIYDEDSAVVTITVSNATTMTGGDDAEGIEEIRNEAPNVFSTGDRAVTKEDFEAIIVNYGSVADVNVWGENEETPPNYTYFNIIRLCMLLDGWYLPTATFKATLSDYLYEKSMVTVKYEYVDAEILYIVAVVDAVVLRGYSLTQTQSDIEDVIGTEFVLGTTTKLGTSKYHSNIVEAIDALTSISYHHLTLEIRKVLTSDEDSAPTYSATLEATTVKTETAKVYAGDTQIAVDDGSGNFTSTGSVYVVSGTINYTTGVVSITVTPAPDEAVLVRYQQDENGDVIVDNNQICKLHSVDVTSIAYPS